MFVLGMHEGDRRGRNRFQRVSEVTNLGQEIVPPVRLVPKHSRTMLSRPRIVLDYAGCDRNAQLHSHHGTQERGPLIASSDIHLGVHANLDADAGVVASRRAGVKSFFVRGQTLEDCRVVHGEVP